MEKEGKTFQLCAKKFENRQSSYYLARGIVNHCTVWLERQSIIREKIVSSDRGKKVARREKLDGEFEHFISFVDLFGLYLAARSGLRPQKIRLRTTHPRAKLLTLHRLTSLASFFARRFLEVESEGVPLHPHVFQRLVNDGGRCGENSDYILSLSLNDLSSEIDRALQMNSLSFPPPGAFKTIL